MSFAWPPAAFDSRRLDLSGLRPRAVRSWFTKHNAEFASTTAEDFAVGPSAEAQTVAAEAGDAATAATAARRRRRGSAFRSQVRIYRHYRVANYLALVPRRMF